MGLSLKDNSNFNIVLKVILPLHVLNVNCQENLSNVYASKI